MTSRFYGNCDVQEALQTGNVSVDFSFLCVYWFLKEHFTIQVTLEKLCREAGWQHSAPHPRDPHLHTKNCVGFYSEEEWVSLIFRNTGNYPGALTQLLAYWHLACATSGSPRSPLRLASPFPVSLRHMADCAVVEKLVHPWAFFLMISVLPDDS